MSEQASSFQISKREVQTALSSDVEMSIRKTDWKRVYRKVKTIPRETSLYETVENMAWGVSGSALLSLIPLYQATQDVEPWVKPTFWSVVVSAGLMAFMTNYFRRQRSEVIRASCEEVLDDMREVYETFFQDGSLDRS